MHKKCVAIILQVPRDDNGRGSRRQGHQSSSQTAQNLIEDKFIHKNAKMHIVYSFFYSYMYSSEVPVKNNGIIYGWTGISAWDHCSIYVIFLASKCHSILIQTKDKCGVSVHSMKMFPH